MLELADLLRQGALHQVGIAAEFVLSGAQGMSCARTLECAPMGLVIQVGGAEG